jgi:hypothetical protein
MTFGKKIKTPMLPPKSNFKTLAKISNDVTNHTDTKASYRNPSEQV